MRQSTPALRSVILFSIAVLAVEAVATFPLSAAAVDWTVWSSLTVGSPTGGALGSINGLPTLVNVSYTGEVLPSSYTGFGPPPGGLFPSWTPGTTFSGGSVGNSPSNLGSIALSGGPATGVNTLNFSPAAIDPVMAIWSLGSANLGTPAQFVFPLSESFTIEGGGPNTETGGGPITFFPPNDVFGIEGNGVIQFHGTYSSLTWTNPIFENDYAFTVGAEGVVPEPASLGLMALVAFASLARRR
ncbi:MAG: PEP-CTERM sorting domain-containing protein [Tepidisphaeraceae bacterium]|jgi:hypothetical protein